MKINKIFFNNTNKTGQPYVDKKGKPYQIANIYFQGQEKSASIFVYPGSEVLGWGEGMEVDVILERNGDFLNARIPNKSDELEKRVNVLENFVRGICVLNGLKTKPDSQVNQSYQPAPENAPQGQIEASQTITAEDLPF
jgi:hypothetical protein